MTQNKYPEKEWVKEFESFLSAEEISVPDHISQKILAFVHEELAPSSWFVFTKVFMIHSIVGTLSLAICNQFGMSPFHSGFSMMEYYMQFGHSACMFFCGIQFMSLSLILARVFLRREEFHVLSKNVYLQIFCLSTLSLVAFIAFGAEIAIGIGALWLVGGVVGGVLVVKSLDRIAI